MVDEPEDLIGDAARTLIGTELSRLEGTVVKKEFQRWAASVTDRNPLYFDEAYSRAQGYRDVIMPPMYLQHVTFGVADPIACAPWHPGRRRQNAPAEGAAAHGRRREPHVYELVYDGDGITRFAASRTSNTNTAHPGCLS